MAAAARPPRMAHPSSEMQRRVTRLALAILAVTLALPPVPAAGAPSDDYRSGWLDQSPYPTLTPGATTTYTVRYRNLGLVAWRRGTASQVNLAVNGDSTAFAQQGMAVNWLSANRLATTVEPVVEPGGLATFTFSVRAPTTPGTYRVPLRLVVDGLIWLEDYGVFFALRSESGFHAQWVSQSPWPTLQAGTATPPISISFRNTGTRSWVRGTPGQQVNLGVLNDDTSWAAYAINWPSANRVATTSQATVAPGATGTFTFAMRAPATPGTYALRLRPVVDGVEWLEDQGVFVQLTVTPDPSARAPTLVDTVAQSGLANAWDVAFAPDGRMFVTERRGRLRVYASGAPGAALLGTTTIAVHATGESGLMGVALDPAFATNGLLYLCASRDDENQWRNQILRYRMSGNLAVFDGYVIRRNMVAGNVHDGCRLRFGPDGRLWATMGEAGNASLAQDPDSYNGKVLRVNGDGSVPADNPFLPGAEERTAVYTLGHRNPQGIAFQPGSGAVFAVEHGPDCNDEINVIVNGANYGWPTRSGSDGPGGFADPAWASGCPTIATSGGTFVSGTAWAAWSGSLFVATLKEMDLRRFVVEGTRVTAAEVLLNGKYGRLRVAVLGPDGALYLTTDNGTNDRVIRLAPQ